MAIILQHSVCVQVVHFIRHGKGFHNEVVEYADYAKWDFFDAHLTEQGWRQARALNSHIKAQAIQVCLVSTFTGLPVETGADKIPGGATPVVHCR